MSSILLAGVIIVNLALVCYTVGIARKQLTHRVGAATLRWLLLGVTLDVTATAFMIAGSSRGAFTGHGLLGFSSLAAMVAETALAWRHRSRFGDQTVPRWLQNYSRIAYVWWIVAYITGATLVMAARG